MITKYVCLVLCFCVLPSYCCELKSTSCEGSLCLCLFAGESGGSLPWNESYDACKKKGLALLRIESNETQQHVGKLLNPLPQSTERRVWIGGRRSTDVNEWRYMNGTILNIANAEQYKNDSTPYCLYVLLRNGSKPQYYAVDCGEQHGNSSLLCQYTSIASCRSEELDSGDKCYVKTSYNGTPSNRIDWYRGQTHCRSRDIRGDIAYSYLDDITTTAQVMSFVDDGAASVQLWVGVSRAPWLWVTDNNNDTVNKPIKYFYWNNSENASRLTRPCIYIDVDTNNKWIADSCNKYLKYFVCMNRSSALPGETTEATTITTTTGTFSNFDNTSDNKRIETKSTETPMITHTTTLNNNTMPLQRDALNKKPLQPAYIAVIVVVVVILVGAVVGLIVFFMLKKRRPASKPPRDVNTDLHNSASTPQGNDYVVYSDLKTNGQDDYDDVLDPHGVTGTTNVRSNDIKHLETPSGDLYAISSKQVKKIEDNENKDGQIRKDKGQKDKEQKDKGQKDKENEILEELYAKPNKKTNEKPKLSKGDKERGTSGNGVNTGTPSGDHKQPETKYTEHFEAPSGEVYARVTTIDKHSED